MTASLPSAGESERLDALRAYEILDTPAEGAFDDFTALAAQICGVPISLISLVDAERQWFKSVFGLNVTETPRDYSFCAHAIHGVRVMEVEDARNDARFARNPLVTGEPHVRFYAGAPLVVGDGHRLGTLCVVDRVARQLSDWQREALTRLSRQVVAQLELRRTRRALEQELAQHLATETRLAGVLDVALDCIVTIDAAGRCVDFNPAAERTFGYQRSEMTGRDIFSLILPDSQQAALTQICARAAAGDPAHRVQLVARRANGLEFPIEFALTRLAGAKASVRAAYIRDISEERRLQAQRDGMLRELRDFAHVVSHDLKAPLRGISAVANWLQSDYGEKLGAEGATQLRLLTGRVKRLGALIDGILSYSHVGRVQGERGPVALDELVRSTIELLAPPAHIAIVIETPLPQVTLDPTRAQQVFQNLLSNAVKYMDKPAGRVGVRCVAEGDWWHFAVADNGPGIEAKYFERIFGLFQTLAPRDEIESSGVGLAVVKKIVETEGGHVWVESEYGHGATFHFTLPRGAPPSA